MEILPAVDMLDGKAVRLLRGSYDDVSEYADDPVEVAHQFVDEGARLVHVVDLNAARGRERSIADIVRLGESGVAFQIGGGIGTPEVARDAIEVGAERVVVGSVLLDGGDTARGIVDAVGAERVVAAIDVRDGRVRGSGWLDEGRPVSEVLARVGSLGIVRVLVTGIETDGTMDGPAFGLLAEVRDAMPDIAIIASGGVGTLDDIAALASSDLRFEAAIVGRALYENRFSLPGAITAAS